MYYYCWIYASYDQTIDMVYTLVRLCTVIVHFCGNYTVTIVILGSRF